MQVVFHPRAAEEADAIDLWWRVNRPAAPDLFNRELEDAVARVASAPTLGRPADPEDPDFPAVRRVLMRRTRYHVYFVVDGDILEVVAVWHAARERGPTFRR